MLGTFFLLSIILVRFHKMVKNKINGVQDENFQYTEK